MKNLCFYSLAMLIMLIISYGCSHADKKVIDSEIKYTCPMHPQIVQDVDGLCPICKMDLVPMNRGGNEMELTLNASQIQLANVQTLKIGTSMFETSKLLNARLVSNPEAAEIISGKFPGRIEKLFVKETGKMITAGSPVYSIYSEELQTLQQDYLLQSRQAEAFPTEKIYQTLRDAAAAKLRLFGLSQAQISALTKGNNLSANTVYAKISGLVKEINVSEGSYITEGTPIIELQNFSQLWAEADVYPTEVNLVKLGMQVKIKINGVPGAEQSLRINFISPQINPGTQLLTIRGIINNKDGNLQPGMQATVLLPSTKVDNAVRLPLDAVLRSAEGAHVWIRTGKETFTPRNVTTGAENASNILITSGLKAGEEVVISGSYLLYSEFVLKKGLNPMAAHNH